MKTTSQRSLASAVSAVWGAQVLQAGRMLSVTE